MVLQISEELAGAIQQEAQTCGKTVEDFLKSAIRREPTLDERQKIEQEQERWSSLPLSERAKYDGEFIAVHTKKLIDHDKNETKLYGRVRKKHGNTPILIMRAEDPREIRIISPRIVQR